MIGWLRRKRLARRADDLMPGQAEFDAVCDASPCLARLDAVERGRLRTMTAMILADKAFQGAGGLQPQWADCLPVAAHAALPVLNTGLEAYREFHTFILYAGEFEAEFEEYDEAGVVHRGRDLRAGEAWHRGPVVLSLADVAQSGRGEGYHVVVHELAHQIDHLTGDANGCPPLPRDVDPRDWITRFTAAFEALEHQLAVGAAPYIDPYAAESPAEFFAVASEFFFDLPEPLFDAQPHVYRLLARVYRQDPLARMRRAGRFRA